MTAPETANRRSGTVVALSTDDDAQLTNLMRPHGTEKPRARPTNDNKQTRSLTTSRTWMFGCSCNMSSNIDQLLRQTRSTTAGSTGARNIRETIERRRSTIEDTCATTYNWLHGETTGMHRTVYHTYSSITKPRNEAEHQRRTVLCAGQQ